jgi:hypothetical protein
MKLYLTCVEFALPLRMNVAILRRALGYLVGSADEAVLFRISEGD